MTIKASFPNCNKPVCQSNFCLPPSSIVRASLLPQVATRSAVTSTEVTLISVTRPQPSAKNKKLLLLSLQLYRRQSSYTWSGGKSRHFRHDMTTVATTKTATKTTTKATTKATQIHTPILLRMIK